MVHSQRDRAQSNRAAAAAALRILVVVVCVFFFVSAVWSRFSPLFAPSAPIYLNGAGEAKRCS